MHSWSEKALPQRAGWSAGNGGWGGGRGGDRGWWHAGNGGWGGGRGELCAGNGGWHAENCGWGGEEAYHSVSTQINWFFDPDQKMSLFIISFVGSSISGFVSSFRNTF